MKLSTVAGAVLCVMMCFPQAALPCSRLSPVSVTEMLRGADVIVRAIAVEYIMAPGNPKVTTTGEPDSTIRFNVLEIIRGQAVPREIALHGYLSNSDDFNDHDPPYSFVRPNGRWGSCFANTYRTGAQFLLVLKKTTLGEYTVDWYALGPVNEQLRSENDPWLLWVRRESKNGVRSRRPD